MTGATGPGTIISGTGNYVPIYSGNTTTIQPQSVLYIDTTNSRVGINTAVPTGMIHIVPTTGSARAINIYKPASYTGDALRLYNSSGWSQAALDYRGTLTLGMEAGFLQGDGFPGCITIRSSNSGFDYQVSGDVAGAGTVGIHYGTVAQFTTSSASCDLRYASPFIHYVANADYTYAQYGANNNAFLFRHYDTSSNSISIPMSNSRLSSIGAHIVLVSQAATNKAMIIRGAASQSSNLLEVQNSASTPIFAIDNIGRAYQNIAGSGLNWGNTAFGGNALNGPTVSAGNAVSYHTAVGVGALQVANGASYNTCVGFNAGTAITTGSENILIGTRLGGGITTHSYNTVIGNRTAQSAAVGGLTAIGCLALATLTTGGDNVAVGFQAGNNITTGANNIILGNYSMLGSTIGTMSYNIAIGTNALRANNASYNVGIGEQALRLASGLNANYNTAIGHGAGYTITTGASNIFLGANADVATGSGAITGSIVIGSGAQANQNNQLSIGSSTVKIGKSDGTGEQATSLTAPSGVTRLLEARINGTAYQIPLLPQSATQLAATVVTPPILTTTTGITLTDAYNGYIIEYNATTSGTMTITTSGNITIPGWNCSIVQIGTGIVTVTANGNTLRSPGSSVTSRTQYSALALYRRGAGDFVLGGDLL